MADIAFSSPSSTGTRVTDWIVRGLLALTFIAAGGAKLIGVPSMVTAFDQIGFGQWFRFLTGGWELIGGLLVLFPRMSVAGAFLLACVMVGAVLTNLFLIDGSVIPPAVLLALCLVALWLRRPDLLAIRATEFPPA